ncbi:MAG: hypothetical protein KGZ72_11225 [Roseovarius sp.]|jgi:hypothetical protein|nr:hypothetical protein [Roseovarius sp.]
MIPDPAVVPRWFERPPWDYAVVVATVGLHGAAVWASGAGDVLTWGTRSQRLQAYAFSGTVATLMLTVGTASLALFLGERGPRMKSFRQDVGHHGLDIILSVVTGLLILALVSFVGMIVDTTGGYNAHYRWIFEGAVVLALFRMWRAAVLFGDIAHGALKDAMEEDAEADGEE